MKPGPKPMPLAARFARHVVAGATCHVWTGAKNNLGYGMITVDGRQRLAHRVAYELRNGPIPSGMVVRHRCDNPECVRAEHLELGTMKDNTSDMVKRGRARHGCARGSTHPGSKISESDAALIKLLIACGVKPTSLARLYDVSATLVRNIASGRAWAHVAELETSC